ncbi:hypothetical protein CF319_g6673 [Tilletia indica]|uniref:Uncharacterized protein n=2 Tax=Tilletia TaxID=13289 RepID=A0A8X7N3L1_9BASI|nr:hypothetical protein CF327_g5447 [Tilletia walkeri]KAE8219677.1 hypothetical protein CF319_g6673 [Tilletia indica]KAE8228013.1 hypothetical protein CF326_g7069 [Tilletia indica]KAE8244360.1 hypothetical protein A4X13_0g6651 [Tilletia indica]KAE8263553.1 hypothetical protein A4X09_0g7201 [Tilletia walkeri]
MASTDSPSLPSDANLADFTESIAWTAETEPTAGEVIEKENLVKEVIAMQDSLRALLTRVTSVKEDCTKAESENETLQTYVESVTKSLATSSSPAGAAVGNGVKRR